MTGSRSLDISGTTWGVCPSMRMAYRVFVLLVLTTYVLQLTGDNDSCTIRADAYRWFLHGTQLDNIGHGRYFRGTDCRNVVMRRLPGWMCVSRYELYQVLESLCVVTRQCRTHSYRCAVNTINNVITMRGGYVVIGVPPQLLVMDGLVCVMQSSNVNSPVIYETLSLQHDRMSDGTEARVSAGGAQPCNPVDVYAHSPQLWASRLRLGDVFGLCNMPGGVHYAPPRKCVARPRPLGHCLYVIIVHSSSELRVVCIVSASGLCIDLVSKYTLVSVFYSSRHCRSMIGVHFNSDLKVVCNATLSEPCTNLVSGYTLTVTACSSRNSLRATRRIHTIQVWRYRVSFRAPMHALCIYVLVDAMYVYYDMRHDNVVIVGYNVPSNHDSVFNLDIPHLYLQVFSIGGSGRLGSRMEGQPNRHATITCTAVYTLTTPSDYPKGDVLRCIVKRNGVLNSYYWYFSVVVYPERPQSSCEALSLLYSGTGVMSIRPVFICKAVSAVLYLYRVKMTSMCVSLIKWDAVFTTAHVLRRCVLCKGSTHRHNVRWHSAPLDFTIMIRNMVIYMRIHGPEDNVLCGYVEMIIDTQVRSKVTYFDVHTASALGFNRKGPHTCLLTLVYNNLADKSVRICTVSDHYVSMYFQYVKRCNSTVEGGAQEHGVSFPSIWQEFARADFNMHQSLNKYDHCTRHLAQRMTLTLCEQPTTHLVGTMVSSEATGDDTNGRAGVSYSYLWDGLHNHLRDKSSTWVHRVPFTIDYVNVRLLMVLCVYWSMEGTTRLCFWAPPVEYSFMSCWIITSSACYFCNIISYARLNPSETIHDRYTKRD